MSIKLKIKKYPKTFILITLLILVYLVLLIPTENNLPVPLANRKPFIWNRDSLWKNLEHEFVNAGKEDPGKLKIKVDSLIASSETLLNVISGAALNPADNKFTTLQNNIFQIAPLIPNCIQCFPQYINFYSHLRKVVKEQSRNWDMNSTDAKNTVYSLLYGNRTAIEEIMLQLPKDQVTPLIKGLDEPSSTPSAKILGVDVHSGDILVSRGGAPTSALIARGNDYPANFSHVALIHIDEKTNLISFIESHIETGVKISSLNEYLNDTKLRIMVLRLRSDLIKDDPMLPHKAAEYILKRAKKEHIPYDFEMNFNESNKQFCSEVASSAYKEFGIKLWTGLSTISSKGTRNWLSAFGVKYFETQEPSDLEYDPQLSVVAEWRDPETLYKDHMDNAITDIMLEEADSGKVLSYSWYMLPIGRVMKLYSVILNSFNSVGPVPEGMSPEAALKNVQYSDTHHLIKEKLIVLANQFKSQKGYTPPYWELVNLARKALDIKLSF
jgi:Permuted papain-like amidase enzyme, YaeF/YiiX, C92 family